MDLLEYWNSEKAKLIKANRDLMDKADTEGRGLDDAERAGIEKNFAEVAELDVKIKDEDDKRRLRGLADNWDKRQLSGEETPVPEEAAAEVQRKSLGDAFANAEAYRALQAKVKSEGAVPRFSQISVNVPWSTFVRTKAAGDPVLESDSTDVFGTGGAAGALTSFVAPAWPLQPSNLIADLLPSIQVTQGNSASWLVMETRTAIDGTSVTEGTAKPGGEYVTAVDSAALETKAGWIKISNQYVEDAPAVVSYINQDLPYQIRFNENAYLMAGLYTAAGLSADGTTLQATPNAFDAVREAVALIQENHGTANGLVISPTDWATMQTEKFGTDYGYIGGGPGQNPWGLRVVVTAAATDGLPLVGDFNRAARVFRKGGVTVSSTNSDQDDFIKNLVTFRAEMRLVLGVSYPNLLSVAVIGTS